MSDLSGVSDTGRAEREGRARCEHGCCSSAMCGWMQDCPTHDSAMDVAYAAFLEQHSLPNWTFNERQAS